MAVSVLNLRRCLQLSAVLLRVAPEMTNGAERLCFADLLENVSKAAANMRAVMSRRLSSHTGAVGMFGAHGGRLVGCWNGRWHHRFSAHDGAGGALIRQDAMAESVQTSSDIAVSAAAPCVVAWFGLPRGGRRGR